MKLPLVPAGFFGMVLGIVGLGTSWRVAARLWYLPSMVGEAIVVGGVAVWLVLTLLYAGKWIVAAAAARIEVADPVLCCYVGLVGVATMLAAIGVLPYSPLIAGVIFSVGALFTFGFGLWRTGHIWRGGRDHTATTPVLYLPLVAGSFVLSIGLSQFGHPDWAQLAFGGGLFTWLAIESVLLHRLYMAEPLSEALRPTLGIQLAPPAVGALAYAGSTAGAPDFWAHALIGYAVLQAALLARMLPWIVTRFSPGLWGFSFGATALATVTEMLAVHGETGPAAAIAPVALFLANALVAALVIGTTLMLVCGKLLPAPTPAPVVS